MACGRPWGPHGGRLGRPACPRTPLPTCRPANWLANLPARPPAEGGTAIVYNWETGMLEAIFNVPPNW